MPIKDEDGNVIEEENTDADNDGDSTDSSDSSSDGKDEQNLRDKIAGLARKEGRTAGQNSTLKELGFENLEEGKKLLKLVREAEDAGKSKLEKATLKLDEFEKRAKDAELLVETVKEKSALDSIRSAVNVEIVSNKKLNINPDTQDDIWLFITQAYLGDDGIHIDENGKMKGITDSLTKLLKAKPYLTSTPNTEDSNSNTRQRRNKVGEGEPIDDDKPNPRYGKPQVNPRL